MAVIIDAQVEGGNFKPIKDENQYFQPVNIQSKPKEEDNNSGSWLAGGVAGASSSIFELNEQQVRNYQPITVKVDPSNIPSGVNQTQFVNDFVANVERDLNRLAPGVTIERPPTNPFYKQVWDNVHGPDVYGVVRLPQTRIPGHEQGYRLIDQLINNPNQVSIAYVNNNAYAQPNDWLPNPNASDALGTPFKPGQGTDVTAYYDPNMSINLPVVRPDGTIVPAPANPAIILGHELVHASHGQRGTMNPNLGTTGNNHFFNEGTQNYKEGNYPEFFGAEEFRTVGFDGNRIGLEPSENSLRIELGINEPRASYLENGTYQYVNNSGNIASVNGYEPLTPSQAFIGRTSQTANYYRDVVVDGVRNSGQSALIGGGFALVTSTYTAIQNGNLEDSIDEIAAQTAIGAGSGVAEEVIQRAVNGPTSVTSGMTNNAFRTAASQVKGAAVAGAVINTGFAIYDQFDELQSDATRSQAIGTIAGEAVVGAASGAAGAYAGALAGAAIGSIVPGVGTVVGGIVGFAVGAAAGYLTDQGLRGLGVDKMIADGVKNVIDFGGEVVDQVGQAIDDVGNKVSDFFGGAANTLASIFG